MLIWILNQVDGHDDASELVDWVRIVDPPLSSHHIARLISLTSVWDPLSHTTNELITHLEPSISSLPSLTDTENSKAWPA